VSFARSHRYSDRLQGLFHTTKHIDLWASDRSISEQGRTIPTASSSLFVSL